MSVAPIGWSSGRMNMHFKPVYPSDSGMYNIMQRTSAKRYSPKELREDIRNVELARRILHRQRLSVKVFAGNRKPAKDEILDVSQRLYKDSRECLLKKSLSLPPVSQTHYATDDVRDVVDRLSTYDPEKIPESKGHFVKLPSPIVYKKKYTEEEVRDIVKRLAQYDPKKWPAESRGVAPNVVSQIPRQTMARVKKCSADEVQEIVDRLYTFDDPKQESRGKTGVSLPARGATWV